MKPREVNIAVIGAGIIGTTIAERLLHEGHENVLLIDRLGVGEGCSKGNAGHFATDIVQPLANFKTIVALPKLLLNPLGALFIRGSYFPQMLPWMVRFVWAAMPHKAAATSQALVALNRPSIDRYQILLKRTGLERLMVQRGALTVFESEKNLHKEKATIKFLRDYGVLLEELSGDQVREMEPAVSSGIKGGLYFPNTAHSINPYQIVASLASAFREKGGAFMQADVRILEVQVDGSILISTANEQIKANKVVVAAGAWSKPLVKMLGYSVPLDTERGYHLMLNRPGIQLSRPVTSFERSFIMTPMEHGLRLAGTVELAGLKAAPNYQRAEILFEHARNVVSGIVRGEPERWMGFRPSLPDSLPVIGRSPKHGHVYFAFGHQHLGLTQAAMTAELVADLFANRKSGIDISAYRVNRF